MTARRGRDTFRDFMIDASVSGEGFVGQAASSLAANNCCSGYFYTPAGLQRHVRARHPGLAYFADALVVDWNNR